MHFLASIGQDVRYGLRLLVGNLRHTTAAVAALAIGIGVSTTLLTAYNAMVARPLDARNPGEMVNLGLARQSGAVDFSFSYPDYESYRHAVASFSGVVAFSFEHLLVSGGSGRPTSGDSHPIGSSGVGTSNAEPVSVFAVSDNYFSVLGVPVARGRAFEVSDDQSSSPVALISEDYWQRQLGADPAVLGRTVRLNGATLTIIGITPKGFVGTSIVAPDFWVPMRLEPLLHGDDAWLSDRERAFCRVFARLAPGATIARAQSEMSAIVDQVRRQHDPRGDAAQPASALVWPGSPFPLPMNRYAGLELTIVLILLAAGLVLVVACANVASLQLARAGTRRTELQMRLSLGATRRRVIRQLLTESAMLGLLSGIVALAVTWALLQVTVTVVTESLPISYGAFVFHVAPDLGVFAAVCLLSVVTGVLFGVAPAVVGSQAPASEAARGSTTSRRTRRLQSVLVACQVALSLVLMLGGSLLIHGARQTLSREPGYDAARVAAVTLQFPEAEKYTDARKSALVATLRDRVAATPGVSAVTSAFTPDDLRFQTAVEVVDDAAAGHKTSVLPYTLVEPGYFDALGIRTEQGRTFDSRDSRAVIVSQSAARHLWPNQDPIGQRLRLGRTDEPPRSSRPLVADGLVYEVAGVVRDTRGVAFDGSDARRLYLPLANGRAKDRPLLVRTRSDAAPLLRTLQATAASVDSDLVVTTTTLQDQLREAAPFVVSSVAAAVATVLGLLGLAVALMGIYATVSYIVMRRTREVGIRMAIGATSRHVLALILGESLRPVVAGLVAGLVPAAAAAYLLDGVFYGIGTIDVPLLAGVTVLFLVIAVAAALPPSRRALRVNPIAALRAE